MKRFRKWLAKYDWEPVEKVYENVIAPIIFVGCYLLFLYIIVTKL